MAELCELAFRQLPKYSCHSSSNFPRASNGGSWPMLLKNSLSGETGARAENIDLHNRAIFNDLVSGKVSPYPEKSDFEFFNRIGRVLPCGVWPP
jgi:hypothetical protein